MKTAELVRRLRDADPSGELECCVNNADIFMVSRQPAHHDGALQVLMRGPAHRPDCDVVGGRITRIGQKVQIEPLSLEDALFDDSDLPIEVDVGDVTRETEVGLWRERARRP